MSDTATSVHRSIGDIMRDTKTHPANVNRPSEAIYHAGAYSATDTAAAILRDIRERQAAQRWVFHLPPRDTDVFGQPE